MCAVAYLDQVNRTHNLDSFRSRWQSFEAAKPQANFEQSRSQFAKAMRRIKTLTTKPQSDFESSCAQFTKAMGRIKSFITKHG